MEPIAIIGIGCRFPQASGPDGFWRILKNGVDAISEVPGDRWNIDLLYDPDPAAPGKMSTRWGAFLDQVEGFDLHFFGVPPREAQKMDPQQQLLLEVAWEALEDAGQAPHLLAGTQCAVFVGVTNNDFAHLQVNKPELIDAYAGTGSAVSVIANRLSYFLDLRGPSMAVDTACSSSLVAIHLACQSIWNGECHPIALVGGVNVILSPAGTIFFSKAGAMAPDGRTRTFDARSRGFARGEGAGVVVLKLLPDALRDGDSIYAVIRGSAVNQDGRSNGLMAPSRWSQEAVLRAAYRRAGVSPGQVHYVEAHGTGTLLGDTIEAAALGAVLAEDRPPGSPCAVASVKTNLGHLESAAGIAALIKVALMLKHRTIPPNVHFVEPNPYINFSKSPLRVPISLESWPEYQRPALAGVSAFGFGGTNAHVVAQEAPRRDRARNKVERPIHLLTLSARNDNSLDRLAARFANYLANDPPESLADICFTANTGRSQFSQRLAVVADSHAAAREQLEAIRAGSKSTRFFAASGEAGTVSETVFVFTGQQSWDPAMGRRLYDTQPVFRKMLNQCREICKACFADDLLRSLFSRNGKSSRLGEGAFNQPALFALEYSLAQMWLSWGISPGVAIGHGVGEYVAACVAGIFSLEDALKLVAGLARLLGSLPADGMMVAVMASEEQIAPRIRRVPDLAIACYNAPDSLVICGRRRPLKKLLTELRHSGISSEPLTASHAFHSPLLLPVLGEFGRILETVRFSPPQIPLISNSTGQLLTAVECAPGNWLNHVIQPVRFAQSIQMLSERGCRVFLELGSEPILGEMVKRNLGCKRECLVLPSPHLPIGRNAEGDWPNVLSSLAQLYLGGATVDWAGFDRGYKRKKVSLPTYPFDHQHYREKFLSDAPEQPADSRNGDTPSPGSLPDGDRKLWNFSGS